MRNKLWKFFLITGMWSFRWQALILVESIIHAHERVPCGFKPSVVFVLITIKNALTKYFNFLHYVTRELGVKFKGFASQDRHCICNNFSSTYHADPACLLNSTSGKEKSFTMLDNFCDERDFQKQKQNKEETADLFLQTVSQTLRSFYQVTEEFRLRVTKED